MDTAQGLKWVVTPAAWHRIRALKVRCDEAVSPVMRRFYRGTAHYCPICDSHLRRFWASRMCPVCRSRDRHRLAYLVLRRETDLLTRAGATFLHLAPEPCLKRVLQRVLGGRYTDADLYNPRVRVRLDVQRMPLAPESHDGIYCSHVLEHVEDDLQALRECYRVLRPGGVVLLQVPIVADVTFRDPSITTRTGRLQAYGQVDHFVAYGHDLPDRIASCGFDVHTIVAGSYLAREDRARLDVADRERLFLCRRPAR